MLRNTQKILTILLVGVVFTACGAGDDEATVDTSIEVLSFGGKTYKRITSPTTKEVWLDRNLGASQVCTSLTDEACFGDYYQWGRLTDGHEKKESLLQAARSASFNNAGEKFITDGANSTDWTSADDSGALRRTQWSQRNGDGICPKDYRVPTYAELEAEMNASNISDKTTAFSSFLKLPSAGWRNNFDGEIMDKGDWGYLWSTDNAGVGFLAKSFAYTDNSTQTGENVNHNIIGYNVRCIRDRSSSANGNSSNTSTQSNQKCSMDGRWDIGAFQQITTFTTINQSQTLSFPKTTLQLNDKGDDTVHSDRVITSFSTITASDYIYQRSDTTKGDTMVYIEKDNQSGCNQTITETWTLNSCETAEILVVTDNSCPNGMGDTQGIIKTSAIKQ